MSSSAFSQAVEFVNNLPSDGDVKLTTDEKLKFYALFKQATVGKCSEKGGSKPGILNVQARSKWNAWNDLGDLTKEDAEKQYVEKLIKASENSRDHKFVPQ